MSKYAGFFDLPAELRQQILYATFSPRSYVARFNLQGRTHMAYRECEVWARRLRTSVKSRDGERGLFVQADIDWCRKKWMEEIKAAIG